MESEAVTTGEIRGAEGLAEIAAAVASVAGFVGELAGVVSGSPVAGAGTEDDPLASFADACLDGLAVLRKVEAATAALKVRLVDGHVGAVAAMEDPASGPLWVKGREMATVAEVACVLTIGERAAGALICDAQAMTGSLPAALDALQAGVVSWQNAGVLVDETTGLDPAATASLEAHFLGRAPDAGRDMDQDQGAVPVQEPLLGLDDATDPAAHDPAGLGGSGGRCLAGELAPARLRRRVRSWREREHPESIEARHVKGVADRRMEHSPDRDGMASIVLHVAADRASAIWNRTTAIARGMQGPDEQRTLTQLRPDIAADLLLGAGFVPDDAANSSSTQGTTPGGIGEPAGGTCLASLSIAPEGFDAATAAAEAHAVGGGSGEGAVNEGYLKLGKAPAPRVQVLVMVPVFSLLGVTDEPARLDGHGPIPASMARKLVAEGADSFYRVLVDPRDGAPLEIGRKSYRIPEAMRRWLRLRDGKCPFPGCSNNSLDNEADHLLAWQHGGGTGVSNLGLPCKKHHRMKHTSGWEPTPATKDDPPGWVSPSGRYYASEYQDWEPPHWPPRLLPGDKPLSGHFVDEDDITPDDDGWGVILGRPFTLPPDPCKDWELALI